MYVGKQVVTKRSMEERETDRQTYELTHLQLLYVPLPAAELRRRMRRRREEREGGGGGGGRGGGGKRETMNCGTVIGIY